MSFTWRVYELMNDKRPVPYFSCSKEDLSTLHLPDFRSVSVGDIILLRKKKTSNHWKYRKRIFSHLGIKYSDTEIAHMPREGAVIESFHEVLKRYIHITHEVIQGVTFDSIADSYIFPAEKKQ